MAWSQRTCTATHGTQLPFQVSLALTRQSLQCHSWCSLGGAATLPIGRGRVEKNSRCRRTPFFSGCTPGGGGEYGKKNSREKFFRTPKPEISLSLPHVFGFGRCKEGIFQSNHGYFSRYGWCLCLRAQRPPVCSGCSAVPHPGLLSAGKSPQIRQYTLSGAERPNQHH